MIERERDRRGDEHDPEPEHDRVLVRELVPVRRRGTARATSRRFAASRNEKSIDAEAEQPADRPLHEAEHEHAEQEQQDEQVEPVEVDG